MQAVFIANGPRFRKGIQIPFIQNIDLYHLFARLLNIETLAKNLNLDGVDRTDLWHQMLSHSSKQNVHIVLFSFLLLLTVII